MRDFSPRNLDLNDASILVTGGTGSFGKRFIARVLERYKPRRLVVYSRDELKQYEMQQTFPAVPGGPMRYFIGDVRDRERLAMAMRGVDYVIHAAALKHVPVAEYNPMECLRTNVNGAENVVMAAMDAGVKKVVALSTDKAANPINLYGASKLASDKIFIAGNNLTGANGPRFSVVRYGNVVNSRGSVIPFFRKQIEAGVKALPITDARMTRFWITLRQGVDFVLSSLELMQGGETYVPRIPSMKVTDLAKAIAPDLPHEIVGIRPGEKLHEVMVPEDDGRHTLMLPDRYIIEPSFVFWDRNNYDKHGAAPVGEGFAYSSDRNDEWLDEAGLAEMLKEEE